MLDGTQAAELSLSDELAHLIRLELQNHGSVALGQAEAAGLRAALTERDQEVVALRGELAGAQGTASRAHKLIDEPRRTRRYRLASRLAAPLDRLRGR